MDRTERICMFLSLVILVTIAALLWMLRGLP